MVKCQMLKDIVRVEERGVMRAYKVGDIVEFSESDAKRLADRGTLIILASVEPEPEPKPAKKKVL